MIKLKSRSNPENAIVLQNEKIYTKTGEFSRNIFGTQLEHKIKQMVYTSKAVFVELYSILAIRKCVHEANFLFQCIFL